MTPSKAEVEQAIEQLECDEQEANALRSFYARERQEKPVVSLRALLAGIVAGIGIFGVGYVVWQVVSMVVRVLAGW